ncbi:hypothetical protein VIGAN_06175900, partial [Vigna angularis var. angularis]
FYSTLHQLIITYSFHLYPTILHSIEIFLPLIYIPLFGTFSSIYSISDFLIATFTHLLFIIFYYQSHAVQHFFLHCRHFGVFLLHHFHNASIMTIEKHDPQATEDLFLSIFLYVPIEVSHL